MSSPGNIPFVELVVFTTSMLDMVFVHFVSIFCLFSTIFVVAVVVVLYSPSELFFVFFILIIIFLHR